jgi:hypothetical protein
LPSIEKALKENNMPDDLKFVAIAESALQPHAGSPKKAIGFWQFMRDTGRKYGLVVDSSTDERRNLSASTQAAIQYFRMLHETLGSWTLAAAAYNMGEDGVRAEIMEQGTDNYYQLYLPLETQRFVFRILSIKLIYSDPGKYGFKLSHEDYYPPMECDQVQVDSSQQIPIRIIAQAAKTYFKMIKDLNPEIRGHYLAGGRHAIFIPKGASQGFQERLQDLMAKHIASQEERTYIIQKGDSLSGIAKKFDVPVVALLIWNRIDPKVPLHPGDRLIVYEQNRQIPPSETPNDPD